MEVEKDVQLLKELEMCLREEREQKEKPLEVSYLSCADRIDELKALKLENSREFRLLQIEKHRIMGNLAIVQITVKYLNIQIIRMKKRIKWRMTSHELAGMSASVIENRDYAYYKAQVDIQKRRPSLYTQGYLRFRE